MNAILSAAGAHHPLATATRSATWGERLARKAVLNRLRTITDGRIALVEGSHVIVLGSGDGDTVRVAIHDPAMWPEIAGTGSVGVGTAYIAGQWSCDDLVALVRLFVRNRAALDGLEGGLARLAAPLLRLWHRSRRNTIAGSRANIAAHYDLGNDFFALWLDPSMTYSSAWWQRAEMTLAEAQTAKIDRLCQQLDLRPEHHLLEIGSGWGALAIHAAKHYGCRVTSTTISLRQQELAQERVRAAGVSDRVEIVLRDYRELTGSYDRIVSVEMIEAVGQQYYGAYFATCAHLLRPDGLLAIQAITIAERQFKPALKAVDYIQRYVFPGCCIPSLGALTTACAGSDLDVVDLHDLTPHYARTLGEWRHAFHQRSGEVTALGYSADFRRLWDFYLAYCEGGFAERAIGCVQLVFARGAWRSATQHAQNRAAAL